MNESKVWLVLGIISTISIASIAWNYNKNHNLFMNCHSKMSKTYPFLDKDIDNIEKGSAYGYSRCMGGRGGDYQ